jgi:hypothetical protein
LSPSNRSRRPVAPLLAAALLASLTSVAPASGASPATFEVAGTFDRAPEGLRVRVTLRNVGGRAAEGLIVEGELLGQRARVEADPSIPPGRSQDAVLDLPHAQPAAGVHALVLRLDYSSASVPPSPARSVQWAYLLLAFGGSAAPAVRLEIPDSELTTTAPVIVSLASADGLPHRVWLTIFAPRDVSARPHRQAVDVPATGRVAANVRLFRGTGLDETRHGLLAVAVTDGEAVVRTSVATAVAEIRSDRSVASRLRVPLVAAAALLAVWSARAPRKPSPPSAA